MQSGSSPSTLGSGWDTVELQFGTEWSHFDGEMDDFYMFIDDLQQPDELLLVVHRNDDRK